MKFCYTEDGEYLPYVRDFCRRCDYCHITFREGNAGSIFSPEPYTYESYGCLLQVPHKLIEVGSTSTPGAPVGCPISEDLLKQIMVEVDVEIKQNAIAKFIKGCQNGVSGICTCINQPCMIHTIYDKHYCRLYKANRREDYHE